MKIRSDSQNVLDAAMIESLAIVRGLRNFDAAATITAKATLLNDYMRHFGLKACVVALSGGIDSAAVFALVQHAHTMPGSPIERVVPITLPYRGDTEETGVTNQATTVDRSFDLVEGLGLEHVVTQNLDGVHSHLTQSMESALGIRGNAWSRGQIASTLRTSALSYACTLLTKQGQPAVLVGTTNRDEGGYLGYFGKYSDGAVDVQLISDLHKSEVYALARALNVASSILDAVPTGDMYDATTDEEVFGVPYDFVELYIALKTISTEQNIGVTRHWGADTEALFATMAGSVEAMHNYNRHKYLGRSPAVHLDVLDAAVPGGWDNRPRIRSVVGDASKFVGHYQPEASAAPVLDSTLIVRPSAEVSDLCTVVDAVLTPDECARLVAGIPSKVWIPVGIDGIRRDTPPEIIGSYRASLYDPRLAAQIWERLASVVASVRSFGPMAETDWSGHPVWRPIGINPLFRLIRYLEGGKLVPHYDGTFVDNDLQRSLMSLVLYLDKPEGGIGATRFITDAQTSLPLADRDLADWTRDATDSEIAARIQPEAGRILLFDHRVLHDSEALTGQTTKTIMRTDIMFERADWYRGNV